MNQTYRIDDIQGVRLVRFPHFEQAGLPAHGITTRVGGVSQGALASLNMGRKAVDMPEHLAENRRRVAEALGLSPHAYVFSDQVHGVLLQHVTEANRHQMLTGVDGLLAGCPGLTLATVYADCMAVMLYDPVHQAIGMAHAGWRGTAQGIGPLLVRAMEEHFGSEPGHLLAALGPAIGPCCFEVGPEVPEAFLCHAALAADRRWLDTTATKPHLDLWHINRVLLEEAGIPSAAIAEAKLCTCCHPELFFSHRRDNGDTGRMAAVMALQEKR